MQRKRGVNVGKDFTKEEIIQNKKDAIKALNKMLEYFINDSNEKHLKKANLISFWLKDYIQMIEFEEKFVPSKNIAYKRGNIVKLNFGFNIGCEYGGFHYGIVLDNKNDRNSPVITVIPLTSIKNGKVIHSNSVDLGNEIYRSLKLKYDTISKTLKEEQEDIFNAKTAFTVLVEMAGDSLKKYEQIEDKQELKKADKYLKATDQLVY